MMQGADNVLYERLKSSASGDQNKLRSKTMALLNEWGSDGLRTLVFAFKFMGADEYAKWDQRYRYVPPVVATLLPQPPCDLAWCLGVVATQRCGGLHGGDH